MKKTYVLDTNVLLADPGALFSFEKNDIVLPFTTLEELDKFKSRQDELGNNAREVSRQLSNIIKGTTDYSLKEGIELSTGGKIRAVSSSDFSDVELASELSPEKNDNQILSVCVGLGNATLVTNDMILRVKADACGIPNEEYRKYSATDSIASMYAGVQEIQVSKEKIAELWQTYEKKGNLTRLVTEQTKSCLPNEFVHIKNGVKSKPFIVRTVKSGVKFVPEAYKLPKVLPRNIEQRLALDLLMDSSVDLVTIVGKAGTGKTLLTLAAGLEQVVDKRKYKSLVVLRPVQPLGKDIGYLPGTKEEKMEPWIAPIKDNLRFLLTSDNGRKTKNSDLTLSHYFDRGIIEVEAMTYIRGRSIADAYMIIDEAQNLSVHELKTIITRVGDGTKIVLTGDIEQIDNMYVDSVSNGLAVAVERFKDQEISGHITLRRGERSELATIAAKIL
jgi:PhoH-like ATPase